MMPFLRRYSIRIGCCVLLSIIILVIEFSWVPHLRERRAAALIQSMGGNTEWSYHGPVWVPTSAQVHLPMMWSVTHVRYGDEPLAGSQVPLMRSSDARIECLNALPRLAGLELNGDDINDAALNRLKQLRTLTILDLSRSRTTMEGRGELRKTLPNCVIRPDP